MFFLETSLLTLPNAVARWSQVSYEIIAPLLLVITCLPFLPSLRKSLAGWSVSSPVLRRSWLFRWAGSILIGDLLEGGISTGLAGRPGAGDGRVGGAGRMDPCGEPVPGPSWCWQWSVSELSQCLCIDLIRMDCCRCVAWNWVLHPSPPRKDRIRWGWVVRVESSSAFMNESLLACLGRLWDRSPIRTRLWSGDGQLNSMPAERKSGLALTY